EGGPGKRRGQGIGPRRERWTDRAGRDPAPVRGAAAALTAERETEGHPGKRGSLEALQASRKGGRVVIIAGGRADVDGGGRHTVRAGQPQRVVEEGALGIRVDRPVDWR